LLPSLFLALAQTFNRERQKVSFSTAFNKIASRTIFFNKNSDALLKKKDANESVKCIAKEL
jgi:hypothetical protein